jgi:hypothetical protein
VRVASLLRHVGIHIPDGITVAGQPVEQQSGWPAAPLPEQIPPFRAAVEKALGAELYARLAAATADPPGRAWCATDSGGLAIRRVDA